MFGVLLVIEVDGYDFGQNWIALGLGAFIASALTGIFFLGPESGRLHRLASERGVEDPEVGRRIDRLIWVSRVELLVLLLIVLDMVIKPGL